MSEEEDIRGFTTDPGFCDECGCALDNKEDVHCGACFRYLLDEDVRIEALRQDYEDSLEESDDA